VVTVGGDDGEVVTMVTVGGDNGDNGGHGW
jgi:hypothetical protein